MCARSIVASLALLLLVGAVPARANVVGDAFMLCFAPASALSGAAGIVPIDPAGNDDCAALCTRWVRLCKGAVAKAGACLRSAAGRVASLRKAECATLDDAAARKTCRDGIKAEQITAKDTIKDQTSMQEDVCAAAGLANCLNACN